MLRISFVLLGITFSANAGLIHRYSFSESPGSTKVNDSVGTAHGDLVRGGEFTGSGQLKLDGGRTDGPYVNLPNQLVSGLVNLTLEGWVTWSGGGAWQRIFDFGSNQGGAEDAEGGGLTYLYYTPFSSYNTSRFAVGEASNYGEPLLAMNGNTYPAGRPVHFAIAYDYQNQIIKYYLNGQLVSYLRNVIPLRALVDINVWLGRSNYTFDPTFNGIFDEFRVYDHAMSPYEVSISYAAGPDRLAPAGLGSLQKIALKLPGWMMVGQRRLQLLATFDNADGVDVSESPDVAYTISDPTVATASSGLLTALKGGTATVTAQFQGKQASANLVIAPLEASVRYSFNEAGGNASADKMGGAAARLVGNGTLANGQVTLPGGAPTGPYVDLPNRLLSTNLDATIEMWVTWAGREEPWQRILDFGANSGGFEGREGNGTSFLLLSPRPSGDPVNTYLVGGQPALMGQPTLMLIAQPNTQGDQDRLRYGSPLVPNVEFHLAIVYSWSTRTIRMFLDGVEVVNGPAPAPLTAYDDFNNWLGRSNFTFDPTFGGSYNEFRIYPTGLTGDQISAIRNLGTEDNGIFNGISISVDPYLKENSQYQAHVTSHYTRMTEEVTSSAETTYSSSDPAILQVSSGGLLTALKAGTATVTAAYRGSQASAVITVFAPSPAVLKHRYSFRENEGATRILDSVGTADGIPVGGAGVSFEGDGMVSLTGGYVDLPNRIVSTMTNATFEAWVTWRGGGAWQRVFDFGNSRNGENASGIGKSYLFLTPASGGANTLRFAISDGDNTRETSLLNAPALQPGVPTHVAVSYDYFANEAALYVNGEMADKAIVTIPLGAIDDVNNWLGRSNWPDPAFDGAIDEFRIYDGAMSAEEVLASYQAGPDIGLPPLAGIRILSLRKAAADRFLMLVDSPLAPARHMLESSPSLNPPSWVPHEEVFFFRTDNDQLQAEFDAPADGVVYYRIRRLDL